MLTAEPYRHLTRHPVGYNPGVPRDALQQPGGIFGRGQRRPAPPISRQVTRATLRQLVGASSLDQAARGGRAVYFAADAADLNTYLSSTVVGGDIVVASKSTVTTYPSAITLKAGTGTSAGSKITVIVEDYATNFQNFTRALIGVDGANCAKLTVANGDNQVPIITGGRGSYFAFYGFWFSDVLAAGTTKLGQMVRIGMDPEAGNAYSNNLTAQAGSATSITLDATETLDWASHLPAHVLVMSGADPNTATVVGRGTITGYVAATKVATVAGGWTGTAPTTGTRYYITRYEIEQAQYGKADFRHCLFDGADMGINGVCLQPETQGCTVIDCDFRAHSKAGFGELKCIATSQGQGIGGLEVANCRLRNASVGIFLFSAIGPVIPANSTNIRIHHNELVCDDFTAAATMKCFIEIKGGKDIIIYRNVGHGAWAGGQSGAAWNLSQVEHRDTVVFEDITIEDNYTYDTEAWGGTGAADGSNPSVMTRVTWRRNLALTGYDIRDGSDASVPAGSFSRCTNLSIVHNTIAGNHASRRISRIPFQFDANAATMAGLSVHGNVSAEPTATGVFTLPVGGSFGKTGMDVACGAGQWTWLCNAVALSDVDAVTNYDDAPFDHTHLFDGPVSGDAQVSLDAAWNTSTYQMVNPFYTDSVDGLIDGVPSIAALMAHVAGVEAGVPEELQSTTVPYWRTIGVVARAARRGIRGRPQPTVIRGRR